MASDRMYVTPSQRKEQQILAKLEKMAERGGKEPVLRELTREATIQLADGAVDPLTFLKSIWNDPNMEVSMQIDAAKAALPYVHRKLPTAVEVQDNRKPQMFDVAMLRSLKTEELRVFIALADKMGVDFGGLKGSSGMTYDMKKLPFTDAIEVKPARKTAEKPVVATKSVKKAPKKSVKA